MKILIVTGIEGAENCAAALSRLLELSCELAVGRKVALSALKRSDFAAVVVDEGIVDCDPAGADLIWEKLRPRHSSSGQLCALRRAAPRP